MSIAAHFIRVDLSENPTFARRCESARITFIGPSAASMRAMADKAVARDTMARLGLPPFLVPKA